MSYPSNKGFFLQPQNPPKQHKLSSCKEDRSCGSSMFHQTNRCWETNNSFRNQPISLSFDKWETLWVSHVTSKKPMWHNGFHLDPANQTFISVIFGSRSSSFFILVLLEYRASIRAAANSMVCLTILRYCSALISLRFWSHFLPIFTWRYCRGGKPHKTLSSWKSPGFSDLAGHRKYGLF